MEVSTCKGPANEAGSNVFGETLNDRPSILLMEGISENEDEGDFETELEAERGELLSDAVDEEVGEGVPVWDKEKLLDGEGLISTLIVWLGVEDGVTEGKGNSD